MSLNLYLDYNAATPLDEDVSAKMLAHQKIFANPASSHIAGQKAASLLENSREIIADFLQAKQHEIIFTSGGTESNNTVLWQMLTNKKLKKLVISSVEHPSIDEYADFLSEKQVEVVRIPVDKQGFADLDFLAQNCDKQTLVSIIWANNEIGTIQDVAKIAEITKKHDALLHFDAVQAFGKLPISMRDIAADFLTFTSHKVYGPRGIGGLFVRENTPFFPLIMGGGQEGGFRSGTGNQILASGFAEAVEKCKANFGKEEKEIWALRQTLKEKLTATIGEIKFNGAQEEGKTLSGTLSITLPDIENEIIVLRLDNKGIFISKGSACSSQKVFASSVLTAVGLSAREAARTIRVGLGKDTKIEEINLFLKEMSEIVQKIRESRISL
ncbi:MAG: cysteine desulfurase [Chitinivibrionia bacterium]|nr:cysteine desulfurase [Chitinivibrionia bacterium]